MPMSEATAAMAPIFVGIGGDSGSGKSTLASAFYDLLGAERITTVCLDDYHSLDRRERALIGVTPLNPRANNFALMEEQLWALKRGEAISKPIYDHADGTFKAPERVEPSEVVIVQGLHPFLLPGIREAFDLKVWLDPDTDLRVMWKLRRDVAKRGYDESQVRAEIEARREDAEAHIQPQRAQADLVVRFSLPADDQSPGVTDHLNVRLTQRHSMPQLAFEHGLDNGTTVRLRNDISDEDGRHSDVIEIDGGISTEDAMGEDELGERKRIAMPAPVWLVIAPQLLLAEMVEVGVQGAGVIPYDPLDPGRILS